jgi:hypothetical protein
VSSGKLCEKEKLVKSEQFTPPKYGYCTGGDTKEDD